MSLRTTYSLIVQGGVAASYKMCLGIVMVIGKCTDVFRGIFFGLGGGGYVGGSFLGGIFHGGREIQ